MTGKRWLVAVVVGIVSASSGCISCASHVCKPVLDVGPNCEVPLFDRRHVYTVLVNGVTPPGPSGLEGLRDRLAEHGYEKVYYGQLYHEWWIWQEMKRVHADDPSARFVLVGYDFGCFSVTGLAKDAVGKGIPVDFVLLLDPVVRPKPGSCPVHTVSVRCVSGPTLPRENEATVLGTTHLDLPTNTKTLEIVCAALKRSAMQVEHPPSYELADPSAAELGRFPLAPPPADAGADWLFLYDQPGTHAVPLPPVHGWPYSFPTLPGQYPGTWPTPARPDRLLPPPRKVEQD